MLMGKDTKHVFQDKLDYGKKKYTYEFVIDFKVFGMDMLAVYSLN